MKKLSEHEHVILVDEHDQVLGTEEKLRAHQEGLLHRAFSVFILKYQEDIPEILMQKRQRHKYHTGGLWTNTCCSHPRPGEATLAAAHRRLQEEMGFSVPLEQVGTFQYRAKVGKGLIENEMDHVFVGHLNDEHCPQAVSQQFNLDEVSDSRWQRLDDLQAEMEKHPRRFTPWLDSALQLIIQFEADKNRLT